MGNEILISASEFIETLQQRGLVIVSAKEFEAGNDILRSRLMKRKMLTLKEITDHKLLPLHSKKGIEDWIKNGKIRAEEVIREQHGKQRILVLTSAIKRLGYGA